MTFDPQSHLIKLPKRVKNPDTGKWETREEDYLEVKWRLCWFRDRYPHGRIETEEVCIDLDRVVSVEVTTTVDGKRQTQQKTGTGYVRFKARVEDGEGGVATGYGTENAAECTDFVERAETRSMGRALAGLGIGTQFVGAELADDHMVEAPVVSAVATLPAAPNGHTPAAPEVTEGLERPTEAHIAALANLALTECHEDKEVYDQRIRQTMGLKPSASVAPRLLTRTMSLAQYMTLFAYYRRLEAQLAKSPQEATSGTPSQDALVTEPAPAPAAEGLPVDPPGASAAESSSAQGPTQAEVDRHRLRHEVLSWQVNPAEIEHILSHHPLDRARTILWKARRNEPPPTWVAAD